MTTHLMLDIETLGVRPGFVVLSAAFVRFSDLAATSCVLDRDEQTAIGLESDPSTWDWWLQQPPLARDAAMINPVSLIPALNHFTAWLTWAEPNIDARFVWCHGASFDAPLLQEVYRRAGVPCPWSFRNVRDTRTLYDLAGVDPKQFATGTPHVAADDAIAQTKAALEALRILAPRSAAT